MDVMTILIMLVIGHLLVSLLSYGYFKKNPNNVLKLLIIGQALLVLAYSLLILRVFTSSITTIIFGNAFLVSVLGLQAATLLISIGAWNNKVRNIYILGFGIIMSVFSLYVFSWNESNIRIVIITFATLLLYIYPIYKLFFDKQSTFFRKILGITLLTVVFALSIRIINALNPAVDMVLLGSNISNAIAFIALYILMIVNGFGLLLVIKENDDIKLLLTATRDGLTGVYNKGLLTEECNKQIELHRRKNMPLVFLTLDLDHFKNINDCHGHDVGDKVLKHFTNTISAGLRTSDLFGRMGGDEFAVLLPNTGFDDGYIIAERLRSEVEHISIESVKITVSIGLHALVPDANTDFEGIFKAADKELYIIKNAGRNSVGFHKENSYRFE